MKNTYTLKNQCKTPKFNIKRKCCRVDEVNDEKKICFGLAATTFKERFGNHKKDFNHKQHSKNNELSKYLWSLKNEKIPYTIKWLIEYFDDIRLLNKRSKFNNHCRHQSNLLLKKNDSVN